MPKNLFNFALCMTIFADQAEPDSQRLKQVARVAQERRQAGFSDAFLVIGFGYPDNAAMSFQLESLGLPNCACANISDEYPDESNAEWLGSEISSWLSSRANAPVPTTPAIAPFKLAGYPPEGWHWVGVMAHEDAYPFHSELVADLVSSSFRAQLSTWLAIALSQSGVADELDEELGFAPEANRSGLYESKMLSVATVRWLDGFESAAEDSSRDFDYAYAATTAKIDPLLLGFEAGKDATKDFVGRFDSCIEEEDSPLGLAMRYCLQPREDSIRDALVNFMGSHTVLFWSLYRSIWPDYETPYTENMDDLLSLRFVDIGDVDQAFMFTTGMA